MKAKFYTLFALSLLALGACSTTQLKITGYEIDKDNNIVVKYDDSSTQVLGNITDLTIAGMVTSVTISSDGAFVINGVRTSKKATFTSVTISNDGFYVIDGIKTTIVAANSYKVMFDTGFSKKVNEQLILEGHKVERPSLERTGYEFNGWFCNNEEWRFNSDVVLNDMTLTAKWTANKYHVSFVNEKGDNPEAMDVEFDSNYVLPKLDPVDGYAFAGWYNGTSKVVDGKWENASDVELTAKWTAKSYTITLDPNGGSISQKSKVVTYGENFTLPVPTNTFGAFKGWYVNDVKITDSNGKSLAPYSFTDGVTASTEWIEEISTVAQLKAISNGLNGHYKLTANLDLSQEEWTPIGTATAPFTGVFDGDGHNIGNLKITTGREYNGLFGVNSGNIKNLKLDGVNVLVTDIQNNSYVAGVVAFNKGELSNLEVSGSVETGSHSSEYKCYTSGIAAYNSGKVTNCINNSNIIGTDYVSGIVCLDGRQYASFEKCINTGNITGTTYVSGVVSCVSNKTDFKQCKNSGDIGGIKYSGGILASVQAHAMVSFKESCNSGNVSVSTGSNNYAGGLAGFVYYGDVSDCYNNANISNGNHGGLLGNAYSSGNILRTYSAGLSSGGFISSYMGKDSTIGDTIIYGSFFESGYAVLSNCFYTEGIISNATKTEVDYSKSFFVDQLYWSDEVWSFSGTTYPTLLWENAE